MVNDGAASSGAVTTARAALIDPTADPAWRAFLERAPQASIFHHPAWLKTVRDQYGYALNACCVIDERDQIAAGLPLASVRSRITGSRLIALPFSDVCPPLAAGSSAATGLARALEDERGRTGLDIEIRGELPALRSASAVSRFYHHQIPLDPDVRVVERNFARSQARRGVAKARREGLVAERRTDAEALEIFYGLHVRTRARQGVPVQPKRFIRRIGKLFAAGLGFVLIVHDRRTPMAAAVFLTFKQTITYKYGASDVRHLSKRPNNLLFMEAITWACENGFRTFDLGRTNLDNRGLCSFKRAWGAEETPLFYTYLRDRRPGPDGGLASRVLATVIRRSPPAVGRLVGEALYGHFP